MMLEDLPILDLSDAELCWLLGRNDSDELFDTNEFREFINNSSIKSFGIENNFEYVTV